MDINQATLGKPELEAEYIVSAETVKSALWIKQLLSELGYNVTPKILIDNLSAIKLIKDQKFFKRSKHLQIRFHFIREKFERREITLEHVRTELMEADGLTKALQKNIFIRLKKLIGFWPENGSPQTNSPKDPNHRPGDKPDSRFLQI